jgi:tRNA A-37 threonylcarbamoyl transferase component Bud32
MILAKLRLKRNVQKVLNKRPTLKSTEITDGSIQFKFLSEFEGLLNNDWFDAEYWLSLKKVTGTSKGRFTTYFIETDNNNDETVEMVLRHYYRGGMVRHFNKDKFIFKNVTHSRAYLEFELLAKMWEIGLPVPRPLACKVKHHSLSFYSNDILIERIAGAKDAYNLLLKKELTPNVWNEIGKTIRLFHDNNVFHADLNIHNILISNQTDITLIDFDRCEFRLSSEDWKQSNLERLKRSLLKEKGLNSNFHFNEQNWHELLAGYKE